MYHKDFFYKDSSLIGVIAPRGTGKTLLLTALAHEELITAVNEGYDKFKIYHNGFLNPKADIWQIPGETESRLVEYSLEDIVTTVDTGYSSMENGLVLLDEAASIQDNRLGALAYGTVLFSHWIIMIRKIGLTIIWAGQNEELDRRIKSQTDIVLYCTVARKMKGKEVGITAVYQNGVYSYEGNRRKFMFYNLNKFWDAYDTTKIIRTEQMSKQDIKMLQDEQVEEKIYDDIYKHLKTQPEKKLSLMEVKKLTGVDWKLSEIEKYLKFIGKSTRVKGIYDFEHIY